jgi:KDO2-lipid IV(A) lauroyltransferase
MTDPTYTYRAHPFTAEKLFSLAPDGLAWRDRGRARLLAFADVVAVEIFQERLPGSSAAYWACVLHRRGGGRVKLSAGHRVGLFAAEDRSAAYFPFVHALMARLDAARPGLERREHRSVLARVETAIGLVGVGVLRLLRRLDLARTAALAGRLVRLVGPRLKGHRVAREQLAMVFPEMSAEMRERTLAGMWDNFGRLFVESAHLDRLWDYDWRDPRPGRIEVDAATRAAMLRLRDDPRPALMFTGHLANWEVVPLGAGTIGREIAVVFRAPRIGPFVREMIRARQAGGSMVIAAGPDTPLRIREALRQGRLVGMLVDQHYARGVDVTFFGRTCKVNPMLGRFARLFECPIYGARVVRLPDARFRFELVGPLPPPRDPDGKIDVEATMQMITSLIEDWVRQHPEQWLWLHRRWR